MTSQNRPYQGYPYVNPVVIDVPSLDAATASRWTNLPRRPIGVPATRNTEQSNDKPGTSKECGASKVNTKSTEASSQRNKNSPEDNPVVYIDLPDYGASSVIESPREPNERIEETFVQETILYDPFKDTRIELRGTGEESEEEGVAPRANDGNTQPPARPTPPCSLQLPSGSCSSIYTTSPTFGTTHNPNLPAFMSKEAGYYGRQPTPDDGFPLGPLPVADFPEPPPAYTEFDRVNQSNPGQTSPPRTEVVTTDGASTIRPGSDRKLLQCQHCGQRVHSLVVRESGAFTHILALIFAFLCLIPIVIIIYCTDSCKYKNHYCPNCNQLIGYEIPILCQQMALV